MTPGAETIRYEPPDLSVWKGRVDAYDGPAGLRWHQVIQPLDLRDLDNAPLKAGDQNHLPQRPSLPTVPIALLGFACDLGVIRNQGRPGASQGPKAIRKALANLAWHTSKPILFDAGDVVVPDSLREAARREDLEEAQELLAQHVAILLRSGYRPVVLGGGHEVAKGHFNGIRRAKPDARLGIVNIDAHFDLRKDPLGPTSGTPFREIHASETKAGRPFSYLVLGIQPWSNTQALYQEAARTGTQWVEVQDVVRGMVDGALPKTELNAAPDSRKDLNTAIELFIATQEALHLTICMDVFDAAFAPGVSAPASGGLTPHHVRQLVERVMSSGKVAAIDIAEVAPSLESVHQGLSTTPTDHASEPGRTARLAAWLIAWMTAGR